LSLLPILLQKKFYSGEITNAFKPFSHDPYGCRGVLLKKRLVRDPFVRTPPYALVCPEIRELLTYCGLQTYSGALPWDKFPRLSGSLSHSGSVTEWSDRDQEQDQADAVQGADTTTAEPDTASKSQRNVDKDVVGDDIRRPR
jgi:hypothetical protein